MSQLGIIILIVCIGPMFIHGVDFPPHWIKSGVDVSTETTVEKSDSTADDTIRYFKKWRIAADYRKASTIFMVKLFNFLQMGSPVAKAAGERLNKPDLRLSDTIRSFSTKGKSTGTCIV